AQLVTLAGPARPRKGAEMVDLQIIEDGAMLIENGRIQWVGPTDQLPNKQAEEIDATGKVVLPGFVDAHAHPVFGGTRANEFEMRCQGASYEAIAKAGGGIKSSVAKTRALTEDELLQESAKHVRWMM